MDQTLCEWERRREEKREERVEFQRLKKKREGERKRRKEKEWGKKKEKEGRRKNEGRRKKEKDHNEF